MPRTRLVLAPEPGHLSLRVQRCVPTQGGNAFETHCLRLGRMNIAQAHAYSFLSQRNSAQPFMGSRKHSIHSSDIWVRAAPYGLVKMESGVVVAQSDQTVASRLNQCAAHLGQRNAIRPRSNGIGPGCRVPDQAVASRLRSDPLPHSHGATATSLEAPKRAQT